MSKSAITSHFSQLVERMLRYPPPHISYDVHGITTLKTGSYDEYIFIVPWKYL